MKLPFIKDIVEISESAYIAFLDTLPSLSDDDDDTSDILDSSSSEMEDLDLSNFGCNEITDSVERMVEENSEICKPLEEVYGITGSQIIKKTILTATEETQCAGIKVFNHITPGEDRNLIGLCSEICYWCCCETITKVSPVIAGATINLLN